MNSVNLPRPARACAALALLLLLLCAPRATPAAAPADRSDEIRGLWVLRTSLSTPDTIATLVRAASEHGFNTLLVQVRGRGDAYYSSTLEPRAVELQRQPETFDPLAALLQSAHAEGLHVHAWVNVNLVSSAAELPIAREHLVHRHPDWLMIPRAIAQELAAVQIDSPAYIGKLARWTRSQSAEIEGLYASPIAPAAVQHLESVVRDLTRRYDLDGVHFDYARYPTDRFDYSRNAISAFRSTIRGRIPERARRDIDARESVDLFAYPDSFPEEWRNFRVSKMTALISRLRTAVKSERPRALVSVAASPDMREALEHRLQDWRTWLETGVVDAVCPMAYTTEPGHFAEQIAAARDVAGGHSVWAGIGAYHLTPAQTLRNIEAARSLGAGGVLLFSYDSLTNPRQSVPDYLALIARGAFAGTRTADAPSR
jgi:uncharacterized lipoprotein YddW (UPF0748 family)